MTDHLVIMAAGSGSRMGPLTANTPKPLLVVAGRSLLAHLLERGRKAGFTRFTVIVHSFAEKIRQAFPGVEFVEQGLPKGTGHAVGCLDVDDDFVLASGDTLVSVQDLVALRQGPPAVLGAHINEGSEYGLLAIVDGLVAGVNEKTGGAGTANTGTYHLTPKHVSMCRELRPSKRGEYELTDVLTGLVVVEAEEWLDAGRPWDLLDVQAALFAGLESHIEGGVGDHVEINGPVVIEAGAEITGNTVIEGPAYIGRNARIGPNAFIRRNTTIGHGCHVGNGCEIKNSILMDGSNVPHLSYVGDSIIGEGCNLGAGTQVANLKNNGRDVRVHWNGSDWLDTGRRKLGCIMGDGVRAGVNASLMPGSVVEPGAQLAAGGVHTGWIRA